MGEETCGQERGRGSDGATGERDKEGERTGGEHCGGER